MKPRLSDLWRWDAPLDRGTYFFWGFLLAAIKYNLDRLLFVHVGDVPWRLTFYWFPGDTLRELLHHPGFFRLRWILLFTTLPFLWTGAVLTLRRLRSAGLPPLVLLGFFLPFVNALLFVLLSVLPQARSGADSPAEGALGRFIPRSRWGSAALAMGISVLPHALVLVLATHWMATYAWGTFVGIPFQIGIFSALIHSYREERPLRDCFGVTTGSLLLLALLLFVLAFEGLICIAMAVPLSFPLAYAGTYLGFLLAGLLRRKCGGTMLSLLLALPLLMGAEGSSAPEPAPREVRTAVEIDAPPERVWRHVVSFTEIPPPDELIFRSGLAYPLRAEIRGRGPGAVRHCVFTTGAFVEPITVWDEPHRLEFDVLSQPAPMEEWTPYPGVPPPHLDGYFVSRRGRFLLEPHPEGRTRLEGTTVYTNRLWPESYWSLWSDAIIHRIHGRVLRHVKRLAEASGR
jgi:hypothetical protein